MTLSWIMRRHVVGLATALGACVPGTATVAPGTIAMGQTLLALAASKSTTVDHLVAGGQAFCQSTAVQVGEAVMPVITGLLDATTGLPLSVIGKSADYVRQACAAIDGIPVALPASADPSKVPVQAVTAPPS